MVGITSLSLQGRIQGGGRELRGHGEPTPSPPHISILINFYINHCFMTCKRKAFKSAAPKRQFCGSASNAKADSEGKGL